MNTLIRFTLATLLALITTSFTHAGEKITYIHNDALGSPVAATNQQGQVIWRETYKPHGQRTTNATASANNKVWFTGKQEESALGINYFGARWYHPEVGRFLVIDPMGVTPGNIHSFNRYSYANNNPYGFVDPDGRAPRQRVLLPGNGGGGGAGPLNQIGGGRGASASGAGGGARGPSNGGSQSAASAEPPTISISRSRYPESAKHIEDSIQVGKPAELTIDRSGAAGRRAEAMRGTKSQPNVDRDEFPPAMFKEGGAGASVRPVSRSDNRGAGACMGAQCKGYSDGTKVKIKVTD